MKTLRAAPAALVASLALAIALWAVPARAEAPPSHHNLSAEAPAGAAAHGQAVHEAAGQHGAAAHETAGEHAGAAHEAHEHEGEHWSLVTELVPATFLENLRHIFGPSYIEGNEHIHVSHVFLGALVLLFILGLALAARRRLKDPEGCVVPDDKWSAFTFFDVLIEALLGMMESMMPRDKALRFLPLITAFATFILLSNVMGLIPGLLPATDTLNTTFALGATAFVAYNFWGIQQQGIGPYLKHLAGPMLVLAPLMFVIELISHFVRPGSLAVRLMGNMFGDHMVLTIFLSFHLLLVPIPLMALGLLVCVVQTLVFTLLAIVYIALAVEEHEHAEAH